MKLEEAKKKESEYQKLLNHDNVMFTYISPSSFPQNADFLKDIFSDMRYDDETVLRKLGDGFYDKGLGSIDVDIYIMDKHLLNEIINGSYMPKKAENYNPKDWTR